MEAAATSIGGAVLSSVISGAVSSIFAPDTPAPAPAPEVTPPTPMPTPDDQAVKNARRRSVASQIARRGRASTILTDTGSEKLGA